MLYALLVLLLAAFPLSATSFTVMTSSAGVNTCSKTGFVSSGDSCSTFFTNQFAGGMADAVAGSTDSAMARARVAIDAACHTNAACLNQSASASFVLDLMIRGLPAGTEGLVEIGRIAFPGSYGSASASTGLGQVGTGPRGIDLYKFTYDQVFTLRVSASASCSECFQQGAAATIFAPFYIYDLDRNLLRIVRTAGEIEPIPEPSTALLIGTSLATLIATRKSVIPSGRV